MTGSFVTMKRSEAKKVLKAQGAKVTGSVSGNTDLLIHGKNAGSKLTDATQRGTPLMTEEEMVRALHDDGVDLPEDAIAQIEAAAAEEKAKMKEVHAAIDAANAPFVAEHGETLPTLLLEYLRLLEMRPDVVVYDKKLAGPATNKTLRQMRTRAPAQFLALATEVSGLVFNWVLAEFADERSDYSEGYRGGRLNLVPLESLRWYPIPDWRTEYEDYAEDAAFDNFVAEGRAVLSIDKGESKVDAELVFDNANDVSRNPLGSIFDYLTEGARQAFEWYWQAGGEGGFAATLRERSVPADTDPEALKSLLMDKEVSALHADALISWLGDAAHMLLHVSETPEGAARFEQARVFPMADRPTERDMDLEMVEQLGESGDPVSDDEWQDLLDAHAAFLDAGGDGGSWTLLSVSGLPMCMYQGPEVEDGEQAVLRLKRIEGRDGAGASLGYADFSGTYAPNINLSGATLTGSVLTDAIFDGANFEGATLHSVDFSGSRLRGANFRDADCTGADFEGADLTGANFTGATLDETRFPGATLDDVTPPDGEAS